MSGSVTTSKTRTTQSGKVELEIVRKTGVESGKFDQGQEILRRAGVQTGAANTVTVRLYDRDGLGADAWEGVVTVNWSEQGGEASALDVVKVTLESSGSRVEIDNPNAPAGP